MSARRSLQRAAADLTDLGKTIAVVGGLAVSVRAEPRFTRDVDLAVAVEGDEEAEQIIFMLLQRRYQVLATVEHDTVKRLATVRLRPPKESRGRAIVDLLFASSGIEDAVVADAERIAVFAGVNVPVARVGHLVAMKLLSRSQARLLDTADLIALRAELTPAEVARAREAVRVIEDRGFARGRDLSGDLADYLSGALS